MLTLDLGLESLLRCLTAEFIRLITGALTLKSFTAEFSSGRNFWLMAVAGGLV
jgi:hypothetical protein